MKQWKVHLVRMQNTSEMRHPDKIENVDNVMIEGDAVRDDCKYGAPVIGDNDADGGNKTTAVVSMSTIMMSLTA